MPVGPPPSPVRASRIAILGGAGAGKSTLARRLGGRLGLSVIHLDRLIYGPGWRQRAAAAVRADLLASLPSEGWIVEGTYPILFDLTLPHADLILWLDQPAWLRLWRSWRKTRVHRGQPREDRPDGCEEGFGLDYAKSVLRFGDWSLRLDARLQAASDGRRAIRLRGDRAMARLIENLARAR